MHSLRKKSEYAKRIPRVSDAIQSIGVIEGESLLSLLLIITYSIRSIRPSHVNVSTYK